MTNSTGKQIFDWALIVGVIVVIIGHLIGAMITDNYYFSGITPVKKDQTKATQII